MRTCPETSKPCHYTGCRKKGAPCQRQHPQPVKWKPQGEPNPGPGSIEVKQPKRKRK